LVIPAEVAEATENRNPEASMGLAVDLDSGFAS
jgi:hypothetical protein